MEARVKQFRERRELLAAIAFEIDEVLARSEATSRRQTPLDEHAPPIIEAKHASPLCARGCTRGSLGQPSDSSLVLW